VLAGFHGCFQAVHKGTVLDGLVWEVLELVEDDLPMDHYEPLHIS